MIEFKKMPDGRYIHKLSELTEELFDLVVAACNLLEMHDISASSFLDRTLEEDNSAQEILDIIINELEEFSETGLVGIKHEFLPGEFPNTINVFEM